MQPSHTAEDTGKSPPLPAPRRRYHHPLSRSVSYKTSLLHSVQCDCDQSLSSLVVRNIKFWQSVPRPTCNVMERWVTACVPKQSELIYNNLQTTCLDTPEHRENSVQIDMDLGRTYPDEPYFYETGAGREALRRVLMAISKYDPKLGYVQGMNFITAALLWHASEVDSFWLLVHLLEEYDMRDNYMPRLPGLSKHCQIVNLLLIERLPRLHLLFCEHRITCELFITDWCFTMFGSLAPVQDMGVFLSGFFAEGWGFFYKVVLVILSRLEARLLSSTDVSEILVALRPPNRSQRHWREFMVYLKRGGEALTWRWLFKEASELHLDEAFIRKLHFGFSLDTSRFGRLR